MKKLPLSVRIAGLLILATFFYNCASLPKTQPWAVYEKTQPQIDAHNILRLSGGRIEARVVSLDTNGYQWNSIYTLPVEVQQQKIVGIAATVTPQKFIYTKQTYPTGFGLVKVEYLIEQKNSVLQAGLQSVSNQIPASIIVYDWAIVPTTVQVGDVLTLDLGPVSSTETITFSAENMLYSLSSPHTPATTTKETPTIEQPHWGGPKW